MRRLAKILAAAVLAAFCPSAPAARAGQVTTIDPGQSWGQWEGWGTSLCWWANVFGDRDDLADAFFTTRTVTVEGHSLPGLGLTLARYNAGACSDNEVGGQKIVFGPHILPYRRMEGFWLDGLSADPQSKSWDWSRDANQRAMLLKARDRGATRFELFSNSPMWWMCANRSPSGAAKASDNNLLPENYEKFAVYLATIAKQAKEHWGVAFTSVEALNEPFTNYWSVNGKQEGCHFSREAQAAVIKLLRAELDRRGLRDMPVAASDETNYDTALATWNGFDPETKAAVGQVNVHGYQKAGGHRDQLYAAVAGKRLWNSEYGEIDGTGLEMARNLQLDLRYLHPTMWTYWQPLDGGGWGLLRTDMVRKVIQDVNPKYYVLAQYSRHIRPGMTILDTGDADTVAAFDAAAHKLVIVAISGKTAGSKTLDLSKFARAEGPVTRWITEPHATARYEVRRDTVLTAKRFEANLPADSIQTFEVENVAVP